MAHHFRQGQGKFPTATRKINKFFCALAYNKKNDLK